MPHCATYETVLNQDRWLVVAINRIVSRYLAHDLALGARIDAQDKVGYFYPSTVVRRTEDGFVVHFDTWSANYDECFPTDIDKLWPLYFKTWMFEPGVTIEVVTDDGGWQHGTIIGHHRSYSHVNVFGRVEHVPVALCHPLGTHLPLPAN